MKWKLRIPMMILVFGFISGIYQLYPNITIFQDNNILRSIQYFGTLGIIIYLLEKTEVNEKKVHYLIGIAIIIVGFLFDYLMKR
jgi:arginine exporter protein ArgO